MDTAKLEALERQLAQLIQAFVRLKEEHAQLMQHCVQLQEVAQAQQRDMERWQADREELAHLRTVNESTQQERALIRHKLEAMLVIIERLEGFPQASHDAYITTPER